MTVIWPGDDRYAAVMEAANAEYKVWLNRNKKEFAVTKATNESVDDEGIFIEDTNVDEFIDDEELTDYILTSE